ncbi:MAG: hypothetical protein LUI04_06585, partial [Porphyromonadaceae bacterium]|nr:hypothetical protein [Porphyromonadaceae bacterium]
MSEQFSLPDSMSLQAALDFSNDQMAKAHLSWNVLQGAMDLDAEFAFPDTAYRVASGWRNFPLDAFLPHENLGILSLSLSAKGRGLDPFSSQTEADISLHVDTVDYGGYPFRDFLLAATLDSGNVTSHIGCGDSAVQMDLQLAGRLTPSEYAARLTGRIKQLDLKTARLMEDSLTFSASVDIEAWVNDKMEGSVKSSFDEVALYLSDMESRFDHIVVTADMLQDSLDARVDFPGIQVAFSAPSGLDSLLAHVTECMDILQ